MKELLGNWNYPTSIRFGVGRIVELPEVCRELGMNQPLLVTDRGLATLPPVTRSMQINEDAGLRTGIFSEIKGNPVGRNVDDGVAAYRAGGHDGVIAFGGGSALDVGKAIALMVGQDRPLWDFESREDWYTRVNVAGMAPVVAVPTTSGTGSEVGRASVIVDERDHTKKVIFHPQMLPAQVLADPELTVGLPPHLTAAVGMDALSHSLEAYCHSGFHPMADGMAAEGIRLVKGALERAVADGTDLEARSMMMIASTIGATAFQKGLGAMHALSHPIGATKDTHHGLTNAVVMPFVLASNRPAIEARIERLAQYIGLEPDFDAFQTWVLQLRSAIGIPHSLSEIGVSERDIEELVPMAAADPCAEGNPIEMTLPWTERLLRRAVRGEG